MPSEYRTIDLLRMVLTVKKESIASSSQLGAARLSLLPVLWCRMALSRQKAHGRSANPDWRFYDLMAPENHLEHHFLPVAVFDDLHEVLLFEGGQRGYTHVLNGGGQEFVETINRCRPFRHGYS